MSIKSLAIFEILIGFIIVILSCLKLFQIVNISSTIISSLLILMMCILTWLNYKNKKFPAMVIGLVTILVLIILNVLILI